MSSGGRLLYVGAGTSGRLALVDAAECVPTFGVPPTTVVAIVAGGAHAHAIAQESAEDDEEAGAADLIAVGVGPNDAVVGISAGGRTPYVLAALAAARAAGALTVALVCAAGSPIGAAADLEVVTPVGPEVIAGSTRMKAGTAQKLALNTISTVAMVQLGRTYGNLMVDVVASNEKLRNRARRAVAAATGVVRRGRGRGARGGRRRGEGRDRRAACGARLRHGALPARVGRRRPAQSAGGRSWK